MNLQSLRERWSRVWARIKIYVFIALVLAFLLYACERQELRERCMDEIGDPEYCYPFRY